MITRPIQAYLRNLHRSYSTLLEGNQADYIPELTEVDADLFGIALVTVDGHVYQEGDSREPFSIQSISKPFVYGMALEAHGIDKVLTKVGMEPSGDAFNSISLDEESGRPMNPMINAGAISSTSLIPGDDHAQRLAYILGKFEHYIGAAPTIQEAVYRSESETGHRNRAIGYMLRNFGILEEDPTEDLELYFQQCAISVTCRDLAMMAGTLANHGVNPVTGIRALKEPYVEKVLAVMASCGMYDYAGSWIYEVGLPAKSGVSGGVIAILPGQFGMAIFSPRLDPKGNSIRGIEVCRQVSQDFGLHMLTTGRPSASAIRTQYDAAAVKSKRIRTPAQADLLSDQGHRIQTWELHGNLVFGSTEYVIDDIVRKLDRADCIILDFKRVFSTDLATARLLQGLAEQINDAGKFIYFTHFSTNYPLVRYLKHHLHQQIVAEVMRFQARDAALEHCENLVLTSLGAEVSDRKFHPLEYQPLCQELTTEELTELTEIVVTEDYDQGDVIIEEGDSSDCLYFLARGQVSINLRVSGSGYRRLAAQSSGSVFGELAMIDGSPRSASVVAEDKVTCFKLGFESLAAETHVRKSIRSKFMLALARDLAAKLRAANKEINALT